MNDNSTPGQSIFEALEQRRMLSSVSLEGGVLKITGDEWSSNDGVVHFINGDTLRVTLNDRQTYHDHDDVDRIEFRGGEKNDEFYVTDMINTPVVAYGEGGDDYLDGAAGNDKLYGGAGNDTLDGDGGWDQGWDGESRSSIESHSGSSNDDSSNDPAVTLSSGVLKVTGSSSSSNNGVVHFINGDTLRVTLNGKQSTYRHGDVDRIEFIGGEGRDEFYVTDLINTPVVAYGEGGDDYLDGAAGNDKLYGGAGNDTLDGDGGWDQGWDGESRSSIESHSGSSHDDSSNDPAVTLSSGVLKVTGSSSSSNNGVVHFINGDTLRVTLNGKQSTYRHGDVDRIEFIGGEGRDEFYVTDLINTPVVAYGEGGDDYLDGAAGNDKLYGGAGNDTLDGDGGWDQGSDGEKLSSIESHDGGSSNDDSDNDNSDPNVTLDGGKLKISGSSSSSNNAIVHLLNGSDVRVTLNGTQSQFKLSDVGSIEFTGGDRNDEFYVSDYFSIPVIAYGNGGDDYLDGAAGNDKLYGGAGNDTLDGDGGWDEGSDGEKLSSIESHNGGTSNDDGGDDSSNEDPTDDSSDNTNENAAQPSARITAVTSLNIQEGMAVNFNALSSDLKVGDVRTARFEWDFGDPNGERNKLVGWTGAHLYEQPGTYTVTLKVWNQDRGYDDAKVTVNVSRSTRQKIYVSPWGSDSNSGTSSGSPVRTIPRAVELMFNNNGNTEILLQRGGKYELNVTQQLTRNNVVVGAYGSGSKPKIWWTRHRYDVKAMFLAGYGAANVTIRDIAFDTPYSGDTGSNGMPHAIQPAGQNVAIIDNDFYNVGDAVAGNTIPTGVLVQGNKVMGDQMLRRYFVWGEGSDWTITDNTAPNSTREHIVRLGNAARVNISHNTFENKDMRPRGDSSDYAKTAINVQKGSYAYVGSNKLTGPNTVGPLGDGDGVGDKGARFTWAVWEANEFFGQFTVEHGASKVQFRNNIIHRDGLTAISVEGYDWTYGRGTSDVQIVNNTGVNNESTGHFIRTWAGTENLVVSNNLYHAPSLYTGPHGTAIIDVRNDDLDDFKQIDNNVWADAEIMPWASGLMWVGTGDGNSGYRSESEWLSYSQVDDDVFSDVSIDSKYRPSSSSVAATAGDRFPGVMTDKYGNWRPNGDRRAVGAVTL